MNERIKELARHSEFSEKELHIQGDNFQRFAELIISECAERLRKEGELAKIQAFTGSIYKYSYMNDAANIIKEHFGVDV